MVRQLFGRLILILLAAVMPISTACAKTIYVRTEGSNTNSGDSWATAKQTVNAAMDAAAASDNIWVARGVYQVGTLTMKHSVHLYGGFRGDETSINQSDPMAYITFLNGNSDGPVVFVPDSVSTWISGFTIRNGNGYYTGPPLYARFGGGIYCASDANVGISNCTIKHNSAYSGGGIYCNGGDYSSLTIKHSIIRDNSAMSPGLYWISAGGGIFCTFASATIANNVIQENTAGYGGGIYCRGETISIINNSILRNFGAYAEDDGGAIYCGTGANATISNNIVAFNNVGKGGIVASGCTPALRNNCVYGNTEDNYSGVTPGEGDISQDPVIIPVLPPMEYEQTSYHLSILSPCINAGWNEASAGIDDDIDTEPRVNGGTVDIGADEYWPGKTYYVNGATGIDSNSGLNWESAKKTLGSALKAARWQDQIWIAKGTYAGRVALKSSVQLYGGFLGNETAVSQRPKFPRPTPDPNASILDGNMEDTVVTSMTDGSPGPIIDGFTIQRGYGSQGGGIACFDGSNLVIRNNTIRQNSAGDGGGVYSEYSAPLMSHNIISNNTAYDRGGGIFILDNLPDNWSAPFYRSAISYCVITLNTAQTGDGGGIFSRGSVTNLFNSLIARNNAFGAGGGIRLDGSAFATTSSIIALNNAGYGGGVHIYNSYYGSITNNTITANTATQFGGGIDFVSAKGVTIENNIVALNTMGIGQYGTDNEVTLKNNDVWGNSYQNYYGLYPGNTDISADPQFVDWANGDYHLTQFSPCINAGTNDVIISHYGYDIDGQPRFAADIIDIGADEWYPMVPPHNIYVIGPILNPQNVKSGEFVQCSIGAQDSYGQDLIYEWSDGGAGGYFSAPFTQTPIYVAPSTTSGQNMKIIITCFVTSSVDQSVSDSGSAELTVESVSIPGDFNSDGKVTISDATLFINEWVRTHQTPPPAFDPAIDGPYDLYPHTSGVWPNWTPIGDSMINISDATAFIQCWTGSHPSSAASAAPVHANGY